MKQKKFLFSSNIAAFFPKQELGFALWGFWRRQRQLGEPNTQKPLGRVNENAYEEGGIYKRGCRVWEPR